MMIILTKDQANQVRMLTCKGHALAPFLISVSATAAIAGKLALPEDCLTDPNHAQHWALLRTFPTVPDNLIVQTAWETDPVKVVPNTYSVSWQVGQLVIVP